ncbi:haloacid dehalogenase type II [Roseibium album]
MNRRNFLCTAGMGTLAMATFQPLTQLAQAASKDMAIKAIGFDGFPIFDPRPIFTLVRSVFPEHGGFGKTWFDKIFAYTWLRTGGDQYVDFYTVIGQALDYAVDHHGVSVTHEQKRQLMDVWLNLKPWPDVPAALDQFERQGIKLAFLSNLTEEMLRSNARNGGIEDRFQYFSTDRVRAFKPAPKAYQMGVEHFGLPKRNIAFCAFGGWDAVGASWFGYPTVWVNRFGHKPENLDQKLIITGEGINVLTRFAEQRNGVPKTP